MTPDEADQWDFRTPGDRPLKAYLRPHTSDWNTANSITAVGNEYAMPHDQTGWMLDVGGHIGIAITAYLLDNPEARGIVIEALPENVEYIHRNLIGNGVAGRAFVFEGAASNVEGFTRIGYSKDPHHRFVGNANAPEDSEFIDVENVTLSRILNILDVAEVEWTKIDCEGCEYQFLDSRDITNLRVITGEVHFGAKRLIDIVSPTHDIQADKDFGLFYAVRR